MDEDEKAVGMLREGNKKNERNVFCRVKERVPLGDKELLNEGTPARNNSWKRIKKTPN